MCRTLARDQARTIIAEAAEGREDATAAPQARTKRWAIVDENARSGNAAF
jgi:hypothetical protein